MVEGILTVMPYISIALHVDKSRSASPSDHVSTGATSEAVNRHSSFKICVEVIGVVCRRCGEADVNGDRLELHMAWFF